MRVLRCVAAAAFICLSLMADQITIDNGDRITGKIVTADEKAVIVKTKYAGDVKIDRSTITGIQTDDVLNVTVKEAGTLKAKVNESAGSATVTQANGTSMTVKPDAITAIRDEAAQKAYNREQERLTNPRLNDFWAGFMTFALANASGNSSTTSITTAASATRAAGKNKMSLNFAQLYATQSTTAPHGETANKVSGGFRIDRDLTPRLFVYGINTYDYDRFQNLDLRVVLGGGFGYHVWKSTRGYLDVAGGGDWNRESFGAFDDTPALLRNSAELSIAEEAAYSAFQKMKLFERLAFLPNLSQTGEYRIVFDSTASVPIFKSLEWNLGFSDRYLSNPPAGVLKNDSILSMGIRFSFDQTKR